MRVGRIGYINCFPVYGGIDRGVVPLGAELVTGTPVELNDLLAARELDVSVVSAVEYARHAGQYHLLPNLAISCDGPVRSVMLFTRRRIESLDGATILVSSSSRTSVLLLELLCRERWNVSPRFVEARAEGRDLESLAALPHDGVLVIGDAALLLDAQGTYTHAYDLGQEWKAWTELPFVFAVWASQRTSDRDEVAAVHAALLASRDWGLEHLDVLSAAAADQTGLDRDTCEAYFGGLDYDLSYRHLEGLTSFFRRLAARGLVAEGSLSFLSVA